MTARIWACITKCVFWTAVKKGTYFLVFTYVPVGCIMHRYICTMYVSDQMNFEHTLLYTTIATYFVNVQIMRVRVAS